MSTMFIRIAILLLISVAVVVLVTFWLWVLLGCWCDWLRKCYRRCGDHWFWHRPAMTLE